MRRGEVETIPVCNDRQQHGCVEVSVVREDLCFYTYVNV
jgi:hypothetical protein